MPDLRLRWWDRLNVKVTVVVTLVTLVSVTLFVPVGLRTQRRALTQGAVREAARFTETIRATTYHNMLADRRAEAYLAMETVGRLEGVEKVRMMNKEGRITFSTDRQEVGRLVDKQAESCYACHAEGEPLVRLALPDRARFFDLGGRRVLAMVTPIYNEPSCSTTACHAHPPGRQVLGVLDITTSLAGIDAEVADLRQRTLVSALAAVLVVAAAVSFIARRFVVRPVAELVDGTRKIAQLDLEQRIPVHRSDEIGLLAASFNEMTGALKRAREDLSALNETLERQVEDRTAALRNAQAQLVQSEKLTSLGTLAASVAHEINNPLSGILTSAKLLVRMHEEDEMTAEAHSTCLRHLKLVQRETERCSAIVRNLLDFSRQRPLSLAEVDVNRVADEALSLLASQFAVCGIVVQKHLVPVPAVQADFGQLRQAFVNITLNACEAMAGGGTLAVSSAASPNRAWVTLRVSDTGPGIPAEHMPRIVEPFFTTKEKGTGLGLSVVYGIVERHGGKLEFASEPGRGTTVAIRLPAAPGSGEAAQKG